MTPGGGINHFDIQLHLIKEVLGGQYGSPITANGEPDAILHLGCGRGHWGISMARLFPQARVTSYDLTTFRVDDAAAAAMLPANHHTLLGNPFEPLPFADASFDFVRMHRHQMVTLLPVARWPVLLQEMLRVTRPGGWIEIIEAEPPREGSPALRQLSAWVCEACVRGEIDPLYSRRLGLSLQEAGLANVKKGMVALPAGQWNGWIGRLTAIHCLTLFDGLAAFVSAQRVATPEAYQHACQVAGEEAIDPRWRAELPLTYAYGQRL